MYTIKHVQNEASETAWVRLTLGKFMNHGYGKEWKTRKIKTSYLQTIILNILGG